MEHARAAALTLLALAAACSDSLVDHRADPSVLRPECPSGQVRCDSRCVPEDVEHCGGGCADCTAGSPLDPDATAVCTEEHACAIECAPGLLRNGAACELATAISAGFAHACAITEGGALKCWGANEHGQLGDGTTTTRSRPADVALPAAASAVGVGFFHTCAVAGGAVYCWGDNATGSLGDGSNVPSPVPVLVPDLTGVVELAAGGGRTAGPTPFDYGHSCARSGGEVRCWGGNESGQLGDGTFQDRASPGDAIALPDAADAIAVGDRHTCAVAAGALLCWGSNGAGRLGDGSGAAQNLPRPVIASGVIAAATGAAHTCAIVDDGSGPHVLCWGSNSEGQADAGDNGTSEFTTPHAVDLGVVPAPSLASAGRAHSCVLASGVANGVTCFGANDASQIGAPAATPRGVGSPPLPAATAIASGYNHSCVLLATGGVSCWGANGDGQLGRGTTGGSSGTPALVSGR